MKTKPKPKTRKKSPTPKGQKKPKAGRPRKTVDLKKLERLAALGLSKARICIILGIGQDLLNERLKNPEDFPGFSGAFERGLAKGEALRLGQLERLGSRATGFQAAALWLRAHSDQKEKYKDKLKVEGDPKKPVALVQLYLPDNGRGNGNKPS